ncbi:MAG: hypothetical protein Q3M30_09825 [Candidatus Electrothrix sp. Rat3]|nr:hypothetical protein [Candidatus Electrothrix rattekaaiensis]
MKGKNILIVGIGLGIGLGLGLGVCLTGCGSERPFSAEYTSPNQVVIIYQGKKYTLNRYGISPSVPFSYRFEDDGDLDLTVNGRLYEVDSPYDKDKDKDKKKVKKKTQPVKKKPVTNAK